MTQPKYELMVIIGGDLPVDATEKELFEIRSMLKGEGAEIFHEDLWGKKDFTYRIKRQSRGFYAIFNFHCDPAKTPSIRDELKLHTNVFRFLLIALPDDYVAKKYEIEVRPSHEEKKALLKRRKVTPEQIPESVPTMKEERPTLVPKEAEKELEKVEEKLEKLLENPDIEVK